MLYAWMEFVAFVDVPVIRDGPRRQGDETYKSRVSTQKGLSR